MFFLFLTIRILELNFKTVEYLTSSSLVSDLTNDGQN